MSKIKVGILKEGKVPHDLRVPFTPAQCKAILNEFPEVELKVQSSSFRCYKDAEYAAEGITVVNDVSDCDILIGIKEVPVPELIAGKTYMIFSHTIKKQPHNQKLLHAVMEKLTVFETIVKEKKSKKDD